MKSKIVKRLLAASLATVMVTGLAACGDKKDGDNKSSEASKESSVEASSEVESTDDASSEVESTEESSEEEIELRVDRNGNPLDLGGIEVIIRDWWSGDGEPKEATDAYEEARQEYLDWAMETYNFKIKEMTISSWGSVPEDFQNYAQSGGDEYYIFTLRAGAELTGAMNSDLMYDVASLGVFDFSDSKWSSGVHNQYSKGGKVYGFRGILAEPRVGMYFNKRVLEEAGLSAKQLYDWQENGEWDWKKFEEVCATVQKDKDNDGVIDVYGMACFSSDYYPAVVASNNGDFVRADASGKYVSALESEETIEALNWGLDMWTKYDASQGYPEDAEWNNWVPTYQSGVACFTVGGCYQAGQEYSRDNMADDFGFVCMPKGPKATDYTNIYDDNVYAIPACYDEEKAWKIATAYDIFTEPIPGFEDYNPQLTGYYNNFRDTESVDYTINRMCTNGRTTLHKMVSGIDLGSQLIWPLNKDNTPAQQAEAIRSQWEAFLEEANQ